MAEFQTISAEQALQDRRENGALLVNAYDKEEKWQESRLPEAISLMDLQQQEDSLSPDKEIIFYCA